MKIFSKRVSEVILTSLVSISAFLLFVAIVGAYNAPTASPPGGNVTPPVNTGSLQQVKSGNLVVNALGISSGGLGILSLGAIATVGNISTNGDLTAGTGNSIWTIGKTDAATGAWLRNDGSNAVLSTNVGNLYLGLGGSAGKMILIGNSISAAVQITGSAPANSLVVKANGNVGIGDSAPINRLTIKDPAYPLDTFYAGARDVGTYGTDPLYINWPNTTGDVQIGGQGEAKTLTVIGRVAATGDVCGAGRCLSSIVAPPPPPPPPSVINTNENIRIVRGGVCCGPPLAVDPAYGTGYTIARNGGVGKYRITFITPFPRWAPVVTATLIYQGTQWPRIITVQTVDKAYFDVFIRNAGDPYDFLDIPFDFIAVGAQ